MALCTQPTVALLRVQPPQGTEFLDFLLGYAIVTHKWHRKIEMLGCNVTLPFLAETDTLGTDILRLFVNVDHTAVRDADYNQDHRHCT